MTLLRLKMIIAVAGRDGMDDMVYCSNNCGVARCLHHPSQIDNTETPHKFAHLHHTDYCPLWRQEVEKVEVVRCKDCALNRVCRFGQYLGMDGYCSRGERQDG